ncbi:MAG: spiro-SPASM protein, partial [Spirochaetaceae bacterium]|nr:spiro-SPASM protein [Spirochaetaceae bacterium]
MNALAVLYGGALQKAAYNPVFSGKQAVALALERGRSFPNTQKTVLFLGDEHQPPADTSQSYEIIRDSGWTKKKLLDTLARLSEGFDLTYFAWAD